MEKTSHRLSPTVLATQRHRLLRILDTVDSDSQRAHAERESPSKRINRLRYAGSIPFEVGCLMLVVLSYRNRAEYEGNLPSGNAAAAVSFAMAAIEDWFSTLVPAQAV